MSLNLRIEESDEDLLKTKGESLLVAITLKHTTVSHSSPLFPIHQY